VHVSRLTRRQANIVVGAIWALALILVGAVVADAVGSGAPDPTTTLASASSTPSTPSTVAATPSTLRATTTTLAPTTTTTLRPLVVAAGGDVMGDRKVAAFIDARGGEAVFASVAPLLADADVTFVNLESPLSDQGKRKTEKDVTFRGRTALVKGLASAGVDVVSLANNHALDWGAAALLDTIARLSDAGIASAGAGPDLAAARAPAMLDTPAGRVAVLAYTNVLPVGFAAGDGRPGVNPGRGAPQRLLDDVSSAAERADYVIASFHWGLEYEGYAAGEQIKLAHDVVDAGADLVIGHHPHVLQGVEIYKDKLIIYSLGDFVFDHYSRATGETVVLRVELDRSGPPTFTMTPVYLEDPHGIPAPVYGKEAGAILDRMAVFSERLGLTLQRDGDVSGWSPR
jgi:poly-gamma-glutamate synthesis protein (capsule biosynthesis protein)